MTRVVENQTDLRGFTPTARNLVLDAMSRGWTVAMSNKGHAIMRWPHGGTTAVARSLDGRRGLENARAQIARVERDNPAIEAEETSDDMTTTTTTEPEPSWLPWTLATGKTSPVVEQLKGQELFRCRICHKRSESAAGTAKHATKLHGRPAVDALIYNDAVARVVADPAPAVVELPAPVPSPADEPSVGTSSVLDLIRSELVSELVVERARNKRLRENLVAIRDLITELLDD